MDETKNNNGQGITDNPVKGVFYSPAGTLGSNPLIGPAHVLLVDFMVTEKYMARVIKDLNIPKIDFTAVAAELHKIQDEILRLKGWIQKEQDEQKKELLILNSQVTINACLQDVKKTTESFIQNLEAAKNSLENKFNAPLIDGAINSMRAQLAGLTADVKKTFTKILAKNTHHTTHPAPISPKTKG